MSFRGVKNRAIFIALLAILMTQFTVLASADISGSVIDADGAPVEAIIRVFEENREIAIFRTGSNGVFNVELSPGQYTLTVYADNVETPGFDYLPAVVEVDDGFDGEIVLGFGATLRFEGDFQYIDTENLPLKTSYLVQDEAGNIIESNGFHLEFSDRPSGIYAIPELPIRDIIIPANRAVDVNVSNSILVDSEVVSRGFIVKNIESPRVGGLVEVDIRLYTIPFSQKIADEALDELENRLEEMNGYGFYLVKQEAAHSTGVKYIEDFEIFFDNLDFEHSFDSLKQGYLLITHTNSELVNMYRDARFSVYVLIAFLTVASLVTGYLLFDSIVTQVLSDLIILGSSLVFFYYTYPGSRTIPLMNFVLSAAGFLAVFLGLGVIFPRLFNRRSIDGRVHTRNLITPIFNMAKRSLRRRRIRFILTFISISLLVMSFVTLTSFSEGYGLITGESAPHSGWSGAYIREGDWKIEAPTFILLNDAELNWIAGQPETDYFSSKAENIPMRNPLLELEGQPIYGVIGVSEAEQGFVDIKRTLTSGVLPDGSGVLISDALSEATGLKLDDGFSIGLKEYTITGIFDDAAFRQLKDLDDTAYACDKWVNANPEGETPIWVLEEAEPNEVIIISLNSAIRFPTVGIQRIAIGVNQDYNATDYAERLALERGYLAWSNTGDSYNSYRLGNYFQGKGATLIIPWVIVVLNVVVTMLNSLYERRKEIEILSSVGLNPAQVSSIFVAEAAITGFIAGGLGYLIGLGFYKGLALLNIGLQVHQKVSAIWSLASIGLAISAVVTGAFAALQNSVVITPSLMRRWKIDRTTGGFQDPWKMDMPIKLEQAEVNNYLDFVELHLRDLMDHTTHMTSSIKRVEKGDEKIIEFVYKSVQTTTGNFYTKNTLRVFPKENGEYGAILNSFGESTWVHVVGSLIRRISMDYSTERRV